MASGHRSNKLGERKFAGTGTVVVRVEGTLNGNKSSGTPLFRESLIVQEMSARCASWKGTTYPPPMVNEAFENIRSRLVIKESTISGRGTFFAKGKLLKHEAFGFYEGGLNQARRRLHNNPIQGNVVVIFPGCAPGRDFLNNGEVPE